MKRDLFPPFCGGESDFNILAKPAEGRKRRLSVRNRKRGAIHARAINTPLTKFALPLGFAFAGANYPLPVGARKSCATPSLFRPGGAFPARRRRK